MSIIRVGSMALFSVLWGCWAFCGTAQFCATEKYAAVSAESSRGTGLWVMELEAGRDPVIRELPLRALVKELACADDAVYLREAGGVVTVDVQSSKLDVSAGPEWRLVKRSKKHAADKLRAGSVYKLPNPAFMLAFTKAHRGGEDGRDDIKALFLVSPHRETLVFSGHSMVIVLD